MTPFVEGWDFIETLGEGAYGEVKLAVNRETQEAIAVKIINIERVKAASSQNGTSIQDDIRKEICIHRMLQDVHVIKFYAQRVENSKQYLFLEYSSGGELFDRIEPDIGMPQAMAHKYFKQLLAGVEYLHRQGVTHRDIKPENLLLDSDDNLKITDFGFATVFRHKGRERLLGKCCGTPPYVAPEVLGKMDYRAQPADIWSCGIVLVAMLAGELPWDEPSPRNREYLAWIENKINRTPWVKIDPQPLALLKKILLANPSKRCTIPLIKADRWFDRTFTVTTRSPGNSKSICNFIIYLYVKLCDNHCNNSWNGHFAHISASQPEPRRHLDSGLGSAIGSTEDCGEAKEALWFSQPIHPDHMLLSSQLPCTPGSSQTPFQRLVKRMTRIHSKKNQETTLAKLKDALDKLSYSYKCTGVKLLTVETIDRRKNKIVMKVSLIDMAPAVLVDFRLSKGDGLEFKRQFLKIKANLKDIMER
ncbi:predicted protein [Nematostella vectensis]|uniref:Serine/threonine-protein kinase CHK1 n=2 Tax=Nematostella vectensis TaxID=45351 RepID=A7T001_NEMVE|nr:predicted protein [Nematostella vectensis]|eukprot:XP_001622812.1 predicted protein [Nematostella vectensis]